MERESAQWPRLTYIVSACIVTIAVAGSWLLADRASSRSHLALAERNRALQVDMARNAMEESFLRLLEENRILASYSFPEYVRGVRNVASMKNLLVAESESYKESLVYCYFDDARALRFLQARPGTEGVVSTLSAAADSLWPGLENGGAPVVLYGPSADPEPYFMVFYPVFVDGALSGLLGTAVGLSQAISRYLVPLGSGHGRRSFLMFGAGRILWASDERNPTLFALDEGSLMTSRSFTLGDGEFTIIADESRASLLAELNASETPRLVALVMGGLLLAAALLTANKIYLEKRKRIALAEEERRLSARIAARERELAESETKFRKLFDGANDGILIVDESFLVLECNAAACKIYGRPPARMIGSRPCDSSPALQPDGKPSEEAIRAILENVRSGGTSIFEWTHIREDASLFDAEISISPIMIAGKSLCQAYVRDITERKRNDKMLRSALEDREILLRELHHRVKNNFQFLESLIELQKGGESEDVKSALAKIQSRTSALAAAYLITAENPETLKVDIREYFNVLSSQVVDSASIGARFDVVINSEEIPLSLDSAVSLGLLFREVLTNAVYHGYGDGSGGRVDVSFSRDGNEAVLAIRDYGRGLPGGAEERLGLTIVRALALQLNGTFAFEAVSPGTLFTARFPLA